jgi:hypothetical protein
MGKRAMATLVVLLVPLVSTWTLAQTRRKPARTPAPAARASAASAPAAIPSRDEASRDGGTQAAPAPGVLESRALDGGARAYRFGEMEIEGRLKSPQIVYFLRRVRAEFAAEDLGHRPFVEELSETRHGPEF